MDLLVTVMKTQKGKVGRPKKPIRPPGQRGRLPGVKNQDKRRNFKRAIYHTMLAINKNYHIKKNSMILFNDIINSVFK